MMTNSPCWIHCWHYVLTEDDKDYKVIMVRDPKCPRCYERKALQVCGKCGAERAVRYPEHSK